MTVIHKSLAMVLNEINQHVKKHNFKNEIFPDKYNLLYGNIRDLKVSLETTRYTNPIFKSLTIAHMNDDNGNLISVTVNAIPHIQYNLPILGIDYVGFNNSMNLVALDYSPVEKVFWQKNCKVILDNINNSCSGNLLFRKLPELTVNTFSESAVFASAKGDDNIIMAGEIACNLIRNYFSLLQLTEDIKGSSGKNYEQIKHWCKSMRKNRKEQKSLSGIFGEEFATDYLDNFLFRYN